MRPSGCVPQASGQGQNTVHIKVGGPARDVMTDGGQCRRLGIKDRADGSESGDVADVGGSLPTPGSLSTQISFPITSTSRVD